MTGKVIEYLHRNLVLRFQKSKSLFWTHFGQFSGTFPNRPVSMIPWLLKWIIFWIESAEFFLNWIIFWIESCVEQYWMEYWMNHFLAKFKHWIESDWVSPTTIEAAPSSLAGQASAILGYYCMSESSRFLTREDLHTGNSLVHRLAALALPWHLWALHKNSQHLMSNSGSTELLSRLSKFWEDSVNLEKTQRSEKRPPGPKKMNFLPQSYGHVFFAPKKRTHFGQL